ncbi:diacylglycerol kinase [Profundibacter sp.]|uniref:diacylglycerol kinase n=1 Tax=Profundibacter sp. TaxID=3101071 RepID=UPI003D0F1C71
MIQPQKPERTTGIKHVFAAASYSLGGIKCLWKEAAFRQEVLLYLLVIAGFALIGATPAEYLIATTLALLLVAVEALNTAIEAVVDHVSPDWSEFARDAKDLGSLAVMCLLIANGLFLAYVLWQHLILA